MESMRSLQWFALSRFPNVTSCSTMLQKSEPVGCLYPVLLMVSEVMRVRPNW